MNNEGNSNIFGVDLGDSTQTINNNVSNNGVNNLVPPTIQPLPSSQPASSNTAMPQIPKQDNLNVPTMDTTVNQPLPSIPSQPVSNAGINNQPLPNKPINTNHMTGANNEQLSNASNQSVGNFVNVNNTNGGNIANNQSINTMPKNTNTLSNMVEPSIQNNNSVTQSTSNDQLNNNGMAFVNVPPQTNIDPNIIQPNDIKIDIDQPPVNISKPKKKIKLLVIIISIVLFLIIAGIVALLLFNKKTDNDNEIISDDDEVSFELLSCYKNGETETSTESYDVYYDESNKQVDSVEYIKVVVNNQDESVLNSLKEEQSSLLAKGINAMVNQNSESNQIELSYSSAVEDFNTVFKTSITDLGSAKNTFVNMGYTCE